MSGARKLERHRHDWEELAEFNPEWAVLSTEDTKFEGWDRSEFLVTGEQQVAALMERGAELGLPLERGAVLDFGCGVGRLAAPLSRHFERYVGVDISAGMIERAREASADLERCEFVHNEAPDLARFEDGSFDGVVSLLVLQHVPGTGLIHRYISELGRVLDRGGLLVIQVPTEVPLLYRLRLRRRLYRLARALGMGVDRAHRLGLQSMWYQAIPAETVTGLLEASGLEVVLTEAADAHPGISGTFYATRRP